jgi:phage shock protein E
MTLSHNWFPLLAFAGVIAVFTALKRLGLVPAAAAREHFKKGALVVDVRNPAEFKHGHLSEAVNIPLDELEGTLPRTIADKNQVLLLHCLSGTRSRAAQHIAKSIGYPNAFNLGSYSRARRIIGS